MSALQHEAAPKVMLSRRQRLARLIGGVLDPRAWLHLFKIVNYYNYSHVAPLRRIRLGREPAISPDVSFANPERIEIGDRVRLGSRCHLWAGAQAGRILIGDDCMCGPEVVITAAQYDFNRGSPVTAQPMLEREVVIGDDVWIGARAVILPGVQIGHGCVVGAGAVVTRSLPNGAIAAGAPARVVGRRAPVYPVHRPTDAGAA